MQSGNFLPIATDVKSNLAEVADDVVYDRGFNNRRYLTLRNELASSPLSPKFGGANETRTHKSSDCRSDVLPIER